MKPSLRLSTQQQLALTPQIRHTIRMLQLGAKELSKEIDETLLTNPLLQESKTYQTSSLNDDYLAWLENQPESKLLTLENYLIKQLGYLNLDSQSYVIACIVISQIDDDGYLRSTTDELIQVCTDEGITADNERINQSISIIQQLDPAGIGCRNLTECLSLQIRQQKVNSELKTIALQICQYLELLSNNKQQLQRSLNIDSEIFDQALNLIQQLDPAPGKALDQQPTIYVQPDIIVTKSEGKLLLHMNPSINRGIELNQQYIDLLKSSNNRADRDYLRKNLDKAKWWLNALVQRNKTLMSVAQYMTEHQLDYFDNADPQSLKPLKQKQIAQVLAIHVSTVSRAIRDKHLQTPIGVIPMKQLLAGSIKINNEKSLSNEAVKSIIKNLIKNEPSQRPLSDSKIVSELKTRGIVIARRTVNKYREQLNIPASNQRKVI